MTDSGVYFLLLRLDASARLRIAGRLVTFPAAFYVYVGSAQRCLRSRLARHCGVAARRHWHIDHLRARARVAGVRILPGAPRAMEAASAGEWLQYAEFVPMRKFGATDSPAETHLFGFRTRRAACAAPPWRRASVNP